jgi:uncharacterized protein (TIGR02145 family)
MKKLLLLLFFIQSTILIAQAPQGFNYQATVRNSSGELLKNQNVNFKFNVMQNTPTSVPVFSETHFAPTDDLGAVNLVIGKGTATTGMFSSIDWGSGTYYLGIELNTGSGYVAMGTTQLLSVPYALYAKTSGTNSTVGPINAISAVNGATITSGVLNLSPADATNGGVITAGTQTIAGGKTFSSDLTVNGITIGRGNGNQEYNTAIGKEALVANTSGRWNTAYGNTALKANTTGLSNTAIGLQALLKNTTGNYNNAMGDNALYNNTIGSGNIANGASSLQSNTTGENNIAIGFISLLKNTTGSANVAVGYQTLNKNTTGSNNTTIGNQADVLSVDLNNATAIGNASKVGTSNTIQLGNTAVTSVNTSGNYTGNAFVKTGGTASQYLMADGSVSNGVTIFELQSQISSLQKVLLNNGFYNSTDIDGNVYTPIQIGNQIWTKENLNVSKYRNGDIIPQVTDQSEWSNLTAGAWCYYENSTVNGTTYGKLYNWYAVNDPRGLAPQGWHVSSNDEWTTLTTLLGGTSVAGSEIKETGTTHWAAPNTDATNSTNFTALPGGCRLEDGLYYFIGTSGIWWSFSESSALSSLPRALKSWDAGIYDAEGENAIATLKTQGYSVRCVKD